MHCHSIEKISLGPVDLAHRFGAKVILTFHDTWGLCHKGTLLEPDGSLCTHPGDCGGCLRALTAGTNLPVPVRQRYLKRVLGRVDAAICPSEFLAELYRKAGICPDRIRVIPNGIDFSRFGPVCRRPAEKVRVTYAGILKDHKGLVTLLEAAALLKEENVEWTLAGEGEGLERYRRMAAEAGLSEAVHFPGKIPNEQMGEIYAQTDIFCLPSVCPENHPVTITEAMACGLPVVASDRGGSRELAEDGVTGLIFRAGDAQDLAEKLHLLIRDPALRERLGAAGREKMRNNTFAVRVREICGLYDRVTAEGTAERPAGRPVIAFADDRMPAGADRLTDCDLMLLPWVISEEDLRQTAACVVPAGRILSGAELARLSAASVRMIVPAGKEEYYRAAGLPTDPYDGPEQLAERIAGAVPGY